MEENERKRKEKKRSWPNHDPVRIPPSFLSLGLVPSSLTLAHTSFLSFLFLSFSPSLGRPTCLPFPQCFPLLSFTVAPACYSRTVAQSSFFFSRILPSFSSPLNLSRAGHVIPTPFLFFFFFVPLQPRTWALSPASPVLVQLPQPQSSLSFFNHHP